MEQDNNKVFKLLGKAQHYAWGGSTFIPQLLHLNNEEQKPYAEYWMGAHMNASAEIILSDERKMKLN